MALVLTVYNFVVGGLALWGASPAGLRITRRPEAVWNRLGETARRAGIASFVVAVLRGVCAWFGPRLPTTFRSSTSSRTRNIALNPAYKFAALWSGQEGSLLLWAWLLSAYGFVLRMRHRVDVRLTAFASVDPGGDSGLLPAAAELRGAAVLRSQPGPVAADGAGLNPLLQYPEMVIHPPMLYLGYVGFSVPFAFALGALMMRYPGEKWIHITRRWTMVTWLFLTVRDLYGRALGLQRAGLGRLLGLGPGRECLA